MGPGFESPKADHVYRALALLYSARGPLVKWLRQWPLTPLTSVRIRYGSPHILCSVLWANVFSLAVNIYIVGVDWGEGPPVPIPNTEVKLTSADNTYRVTGREDR